jgi:Mannose-6-phosphate isomerase
LDFDRTNPIWNRSAAQLASQYRPDRGRERVGPTGAVHRLENPGKILLELIEVQTGSYLGEDDIIRIEDDYRRP